MIVHCAFKFGARVVIDGGDLVGVVTAVAWYGDTQKVMTEVSWFANGAAQSAWFYEWRLKKEEK